MRNCIAISYLSLFISFQAVAGGIDAGTGFVAPKKVACVGTSLDNSVLILSYTRDDNNLFVPKATPAWPSIYSSSTYLRNAILQKSNPVAASPGYFLPVNNYILNSQAVKGTLNAFDFYQWAYLTIEMPQYTLQVFRDYIGNVYATLYRRNQSTGEISFYGHLSCK